MKNSEPIPLESIRTLMLGSGHATLATLAAKGGGGPYASLALVAFDHDGTPLLMLSELADHTRNLMADPRISLLFDGTGAMEDPVTGPRLSVMGRVSRTEAARHRARFLTRHPGARVYADFADFHCYRVAIERAHMVAGFARVRWLRGDEMLVPIQEALVDAEADILLHVNTDRLTDLARIAARHLGPAAEGAPPGDWRMTGLDAEGIDLRAGRHFLRAPFPERVGDAESALAALAALA